MDFIRTRTGLLAVLLIGLLLGTSAAPAFGASTPGGTDAPGAASAAGTSKSEKSTPAKGSAADAKNSSSGKAKESRSSAAVNQGVDFQDVVPEDKILSVDELYEIYEANPTMKDLLIIDIRSMAKFSELNIPESKCLPAGRVFEIRMREVPRDKDVILIDADGSRLGEAYQMLMDNDYDPELIRVVEGGFGEWVEKDYPAAPTPMRMGC